MVALLVYTTWSFTARFISVHFGSKLPPYFHFMLWLVVGWFRLEGGLAFGAGGLGLEWTCGQRCPMSEFPSKLLEGDQTLMVASCVFGPPQT